jgi:hypothetical protein
MFLTVLPFFLYIQENNVVQFFFFQKQKPKFEYHCLINAFPQIKLRPPNLICYEITAVDFLKKTSNPYPTCAGSETGVPF